jgi:hypothetical protein
MKNLLKLLGIIVMVTIIGPKNYGDDFSSIIRNTSGTLTITGLDDYNGQYIFAILGNELLEGENNGVLYAADSISKNGDLTGVKINRGRATLKVWKEINDTTIGDYNGNDEVGGLAIILPVPIVARNIIDSDDLFEGNRSVILIRVKFSKGKGNGIILGDLSDDDYF